MNREYHQKKRSDSDTHHMNFPKKYHRETYPQAAYLAEIMVVRDMWRPIHDELHANVSAVPGLGYYALCSVARDIRPYYENPLEAIDEYSKLVESAANSPNCRRGEAALNLLHIEILREQIPFVEDSQTYKNRRIII